LTGPEVKYILCKIVILEVRSKNGEDFWRTHFFAQNINDEDLFFENTFFWSEFRQNCQFLDETTIRGI